MRQFRFSIAGLLGVVLFFAVAAAALRLATDAWDSAALATTVLSLLIGVLLSVHGSLLTRAYWLGFVLFGSSYLAASLIPSIEARLPSRRLFDFLISASAGTGTPGIAVGDFNNDGTADLLISNQTALSHVYLNNGNGTFRDVTSTPLVSANDPANVPMTLTGRLIAATRPLAGSGGTTENQMRILHSILTVVIAFFGGHISGALYAKERRVSSLTTSAVS
jgi:hypothetical protein